MSPKSTHTLDIDGLAQVISEGAGYRPSATDVAKAIFESDFLDRISAQAIAKHEQARRAAEVKAELGVADDSELQIVNGYLVLRGAVEPEYPAGIEYGPMPYGDAEAVLHLSELPGWPVTASVPMLDWMGEVDAATEAMFDWLKASIDTVDRNDQEAFIRGLAEASVNAIHTAQGKSAATS